MRVKIGLFVPARRIYNDVPAGKYQLQINIHTVPKTSGKTFKTHTAVVERVPDAAGRIFWTGLFVFVYPLWIFIRRSTKEGRRWSASSDVDGICYRDHPILS